MLSNETRPVESITTDANGLPRWVMAQWFANEPPQRVLLLNLRATVAVVWDGRAAIVRNPNDLHEIPVD